MRARRSAAAALTVVGVAAWWTAAYGVNPVKDGSFESPTVGPGAKIVNTAGQRVGPWVVQGVRTTLNNQAALVAPGGGRQFMEADPGSGVCQKLKLTKTGALTVKVMAGGSTTVGPATKVLRVKVTVGASVLADSSTSVAAGSWTAVSVPFTTASATPSLCLLDATTGAPADGGVFFDLVTLS